MSDGFRVGQLLTFHDVADLAAVAGDDAAGAAEAVYVHGHSSSTHGSACADAEGLFEAIPGWLMLRQLAV